MGDICPFLCPFSPMSLRFKRGHMSLLCQNVRDICPFHSNTVISECNYVKLDMSLCRCP